jgi:hypothetical protein
MYTPRTHTQPAHLTPHPTPGLPSNCGRHSWSVRGAKRIRTAGPTSEPHLHRTVQAGINAYEAAIAAEAIAAGRLPDAAPVVTSTANQHYQKHFDKLFGLAKARDWDAVRDYPVTGSNSYSKMVARYRHDLLAVHAAQSTEAAPGPAEVAAA